jgi:EAL domain-containing protein (putative c-di-GMP-specific phosphodiesterase class I)/GGDEF domain-containing protein
MRWGQKPESRKPTSSLHGPARDGATGLMTYPAFLFACGDALAAFVDADTPALPAVLLVDIDGVAAAIEAEMHYFAADEVVALMAGRIEREVDTLGCVARTSDRQVGVLFAHLPQPAVALDLAYRIVTAISSPATLASGRQVQLSASCGLVTRDAVSTRTTAPDLLRAAGLAVREARRGGRNRIQLCTPEMIAVADETLVMGNDLRQALENKDLRVYYQPLVDLKNGSIIGFEALVRWTHPVHGAVPPSRFVLVAEQFGLISELGRMVLSTASAQIQEWSGAFNIPLDLHVNFSSGALAEDSFITMVKESLFTSGLAPSRLVLEVTEGAAQPGLDIARVRFDALHDLTVRIALDDFTTGRSTLGYLESLRVDVIKVDRFYLDSRAERDEGQAPPEELLRGVIRLGKALGMQVYAEGIEKDEERTWLQEHGCRIGQGYLFARPLPAADVAGLLRDQAAQAGTQGRGLLPAQTAPTST